MNVRIFRHNFVGDKAKIRRRAVALQGFLTQSPAKFDEKTCVNPYVDRFLIRFGKSVVIIRQKQCRTAKDIEYALLADRLIKCAPEIGFCKGLKAEVDRFQTDRFQTVKNRILIGSVKKQIHEPDKQMRPGDILYAVHAFFPEEAVCIPETASEISGSMENV